MAISLFLLLLSGKRSPHAPHLDPRPPICTKHTEGHGIKIEVSLSRSRKWHLALRHNLVLVRKVDAECDLNPKQEGGCKKGCSGVEISDMHATHIRIQTTERCCNFDKSCVMFFFSLTMSHLEQWKTNAGKVWSRIANRCILFYNESASDTADNISTET